MQAQYSCDGALSELPLLILLEFLWDQNGNSFHPTQEESVVMQIRNHIYWNIYNGVAMLNGLLHSNDYEERRVTHCIEMLPSTHHSTLDTSAVVKPWKEKLQKSLYFLTFPRIWIYVMQK
ncbi:hypothetical protein TNCV_4875111 [Trichonephila clavipes]|nr:hypothetical protein TNCV_4875111 [Trichonephila clavipes]